MCERQVALLCAVVFVYIGCAHASGGQCGTVPVGPPQPERKLTPQDQKALTALADELSDLKPLLNTSNPCNWFGTPIRVECGAKADGGLYRVTSLTIRSPYDVYPADVANKGEVSACGPAPERRNVTIQGRFTGSYLAPLSVLKTFTVSGTPGLAGSLPSEWAAGWSSVTQLHIENSGLEGAIPASWGAADAFPSLTSLELPSNQFFGGLDALGAADSLPALANLLLNGNDFSGTLPAKWASNKWAAPLARLELQGNHISGSIPDAWTLPDNRLSAVTDLNLGHNALTGTLPANLGRAFQVINAVNLGGNQLGGTLPDKWGSADSFGRVLLVDVSSNSLVGPLPASWSGGFWSIARSNGDLPFGTTGQPTFGLSFDLHSNKLSGSVPEQWSDASTAEAWYGEASGGSTTNLGVILAPGNTFCGPIPFNVTAVTYSSGATVSLPAC